MNKKNKRFYGVRKKKVIGVVQGETNRHHLSLDVRQGDKLGPVDILNAVGDQELEDVGNNGKPEGSKENDSRAQRVFGKDDCSCKHDSSNQQHNGESLDLQRTVINQEVWSRGVDIVREEQIVCILFVKEKEKKANEGLDLSSKQVQ